jgi:cytochrome c oxidase subunit 1
LTGEYGAAWHGLTRLGAVGAVILFLSALSFVIVVVATWVGGKRIAAPAFEFAVPLRPPTALSVWDRFGMWTVVAVLLVAVAYGYPLFHLFAHTRYGSPAFQPF